jgi:2-phospho-L-lactate/phosphoenolpyruvate guanylyltransferase
MTVAVVPVKDLELAKQRLSRRLGVLDRRALVLLMLEDVLNALRRVAGLSGIMVVTREGEVAARALQLGAEILEEPANDGYTSAVTRAAEELIRRGVPAMLSIPADVPGVSPDEIACVLAARRTSPSIVLVPSRDERGTNAALVAPPGAFDLRFGEPSFAAHVARAGQSGLAIEVLRLPGLALDLDTPDDLDTFLRESSSTATYYFLMETLGGRANPPASPTEWSQRTR